MSEREAAESQTLQLLQRWHRGERDALDELIQRNLEWVRSYVHARLRNELRHGHETQDFVQEAMIDVLRYGPRFELKDEGRFRALLARIVENNLRDRHKWLHRQRRDVERERPGVSDTILRLDPPARTITTPSERVGREERETWVRLAIELLEPEDREILWLREWDQLSFEEIATRLELSADAARMRYRRALPRLARKVDQLRKGQIR